MVKPENYDIDIQDYKTVIKHEIRPEQGPLKLLTLRNFLSVNIFKISENSQKIRKKSHIRIFRFHQAGFKKKFHWVKKIYLKTVLES